MRHGNESINKYLQAPPLMTRHGEVVKVAKFVLNQAMVSNSCMLVGPHTIGKSVLSRAMVKLLREGLKMMVEMRYYQKHQQFILRQN